MWIDKYKGKCAYTGQFIWNKFHGKGIIEYKVPRTIQSGLLQISNSDPTVHDLTQSKILVWNYEGDFKNGLIHGKGIMQFDNGDEYTGWFYKSAIHGPGVYETKLGYSLVGHFDNGVLREGKKMYSDGRVYIGELRNGIEYGKGITTGGRTILEMNKPASEWSNKT